jgi:hypothetical protein
MGGLQRRPRFYAIPFMQQQPKRRRTEPRDLKRLSADNDRKSGQDSRETRPKQENDVELGRTAANRSVFGRDEFSNQGADLGSISRAIRGRSMNIGRTPYRLGKEEAPRDLEIGTSCAAVWTTAACSGWNGSGGWEER